MFQLIKDKLSINSDTKPRLIFFIPVILLGTFIIEIPLYLIKIWYTGSRDISEYFQIFSYILHHPFLVLIVAGLIGPFFETLCGQILPIEIMNYFHLSKRITIIFAGLVFSLLHFIRGIIKMITVFPTGVLLAFGYLKYRRFSIAQSLGVVTTIHGLHNMILILLLFPIAYHHSAQVYEYDLRFASAKGNLKVVQNLLQEHKLNIESKDKRTGQTALILAANYGHPEIVITLLSKGANINAKDDKGSTALIYASWKGHKDVVKILLKNGADITISSDYGNTALAYAQRENNNEIVQLLMDAGTKE